MLYLKVKKLADVIDVKQWKGANDFRIIIEYGSQKRNTTVQWDNNNPVWNENFLFNLDKKNDTIVVKLAEEDVYGKTKILKETNISVYNNKIKSFSNELIQYEMGDIYFKKISK